MPRQNTRPARRKPVNLTIRGDVLEEARALKLNTSEAAESGIREAIKKAREKEWLAQSGAAIDAHNRRIDKEGPLLPPAWERD